MPNEFQHSFLENWDDWQGTEQEQLATTQGLYGMAPLRDKVIIIIFIVMADTFVWEMHEVRKGTWVLLLLLLFVFSWFC